MWSSAQLDGSWNARGIKSIPPSLWDLKLSHPCFFLRIWWILFSFCLWGLLFSASKYIWREMITRALAQCTIWAGPKTSESWFERGRTGLFLLFLANIVRGEGMAMKIKIEPIITHMVESVWRKEDCTSISEVSTWNMLFVSWLGSLEWG